MIEPQFKAFIEQEVLPLTAIDAAKFWADLQHLLEDHIPRNQQLLETRLDLQKQIDSWHQTHQATDFDPQTYRTFLQDIGYLLPEGEAFQIQTQNVDPEIAEMAGPQLVVPLKNARFALNAANARWGSLYDALYGTDVISTEGDLAPGTGYNQSRGDAVIAYARDFLDKLAPLKSGSHADVVKYRLHDQQLLADFDNGQSSGLQRAEKFVAYRGSLESPDALLLKNNGLHVEIQIDRQAAVGQHDRAGVNDILIEAAITTIMDCEDSVAAVDSEDKIEIYRNWLGLMQQTLTAEFTKKGEVVTRRLNPDRKYTALNGGHYQVCGRSLLFNRNVGHLMDIDLMRDCDGKPVPEGIVDAVVTALIGSLDLTNKDAANSKTGSIYIVKPKMHGPDEVVFTCDLFSRIEEMLDLPRNTIKLGIMDEERRTTVNLKECIRCASERLVFINTGFLDRTGDEIHTSMEAGPFLPKEQIKAEPWIRAYEDRNVDIGLACGLSGKAQIGKGMWPMPDEMAKMMAAKDQHPLAGATTAWVPSPTAAVLHVLHYHAVDVFAVQEKIRKRPIASLDDILTIPLLQEPNSLSSEQIEQELENNIQGILGYVVRWVELGIGCSKVPDIHNVGLMEDRATLRISAKHVANWLHHNLCTEEQVLRIMQRMAAVVDTQNEGDEEYQDMSPDFDSSPGFQSAKALIFQSHEFPNGYTEPLLHRNRLKLKQAQREHSSSN